MRVLIADKLPDTFRTLLQEAQAQVIVDSSLKGDALTAALAEHNPDVLVVRSTKVQAEQLEAAKGLQLIVRGGAGVNTIDLAGASARGIYVSNCPGMNAVAVAELTFGHLLNIDRRIADNVADLRAGKWRKGVYAKAGEGLKGKTLGIVGLGNIGKEVAKRAQAFDMRVVASSPSLTPEKAAALGIKYADDAIAVARKADILTVHCGLTASTRGLIGRAVLEALRPGAIFINTTRGPVVDEEALQWAIEERGLRCGLDVFCGEPNAKEEDWTHPLVASERVWGTHHIGASTQQAQQAVADEALRVILTWRETGDAPNCVNLAASTPATHMLAVRHADRVGVLAAILSVLAQQSINVEGMENIVFSGAQAALARIQISAPLDEAGMSSLAELDGIFNAQQLSLS